MRALVLRNEQANGDDHQHDAPKCLHQRYEQHERNYTCQHDAQDNRPRTAPQNREKAQPTRQPAGHRADHEGVVTAEHDIDQDDAADRRQQANARRTEIEAQVNGHRSSSPLLLILPDRRCGAQPLALAAP